MMRHARNGTPLMGIAGWKNTGKTTLLVGVTNALTRRGYKIATLKHAHHGFDIDREGTDSFRHRAAGAGEVLIVSAKRWALMHESDTREGEPTLEQALDTLAPCDLILIEGYRGEAHPKLELRRAGAQEDDTLPCAPETIVARVGPMGEEAVDGKPTFAPDAIEPIADFIEQTCGLTRP